MGQDFGTGTRGDAKADWYIFGPFWGQAFGTPEPLISGPSNFVPEPTICEIKPRNAVRNRSQQQLHSYSARRYSIGHEIDPTLESIWSAPLYRHWVFRISEHVGGGAISFGILESRHRIGDLYFHTARRHVCDRKDCQSRHEEHDNSAVRAPANHLRARKFASGDPRECTSIQCTKLLG